jgi:hypothetical protein
MLIEFYLLLLRNFINNKNIASRTQRFITTAPKPATGHDLEEVPTS